MSQNDSEKVVPPKKSKAARKTEEKKEDASSNHEGEDADKVKESEAEKNIFNEKPILEGKRKRNSPASEQFAKDWLQKNLVESEVSLILFTSDIHKCYVESCTANGGVSLVKGDFVKLLNSTFPKGYALAPDCPYKDAVKKKKLHKTKPAVQAESLQIKMKDIIMDAIVSLGNPRRGVSMNSMRNFVSGKYPALRLDQKEGNFKKVVSNLLRYKKIDCMRGIGACGFYRLPRTPEQEAEEIVKEKEEAKEKLKKKKEKMIASKKKAEENVVPDEVDGAGDKVIEVAIDDEPDNTESKEVVGGGDAGGDVVKDGDEEEKKNASKKERKAKKKKVRKVSQSSKSDREYVDLENPSKVEDTFPLAMTYNCEPKEASIVKIVKYVTDFYHQDLTNKDKLKKCMEAGAEKGYWTQVTGTSTGSGTYRLTIEEFDPNADSDLTGMVMNAIVACTEPKISSASLLKKYIQEYHPALKVVEQPRKFKMALLRAISSNKIKQLSGIGATGSFQLLEPFRPTPSILQGKGSMGWPSSKKGDNEKEDSEAEGSEVDDAGLEMYQDAYKPRPSKRRGMGRNVESTKVSRLDLSLYPSFKRTRSSISSNGMTSRSTRGKAVSNQKKGTKRPIPQHDDDEEEEEVGAAKRRIGYMDAEDDDEEENEEEEEEEESEPEYEPKKTRGGRAAVVKAAKKSPKKSPPVSKSRKVSKPPKGVVASKSKKAKLSKVINASPPEKLGARAAKRKVSYVEAADVEDDDDDDDEKDSEALNSSSARKAGEKRPSRNQPTRNLKSVPSSVLEVSVVLDRELETPTALKNKAARPTKEGGVVANGSKPSIGKAKTKKGKRKSRGKY